MTSRRSTWRETYKVHPAADVFPMMPDEDLDKLGEDIKANGLNVPLSFCWVELGTSAARRVLIDGRNRLEAMERVGIPLRVRNSGLPESLHGKETANIIDGDPVARIIGLNIHRRHLTKQQQADLIVAAIKAGAEASRQVGGVPKRHVKGKAGSEKNATKAAVVAAAKEHGISKRTIERSLAKAEGNEPKKPEPRSATPSAVEALEPLSPSDPAYLRLLSAFHRAPLRARRRLAWNMDRRLPDDDGVEAARRRYVAEFAKLGAAGRDAEFEVLMDELRGFTGKPQADPDDDLGNIPACLDRRRRP